MYDFTPGKKRQLSISILSMESALAEGTKGCESTSAVKNALAFLCRPRRFARSSAPDMVAIRRS
jgi:hypothetical protein